jgi:hypothetical protein
MSLLATIVGCQRPGDDLLIMRDATTQRGALVRCTDDVCQLDGRQIPRSAIVWIGLDGPQPPPPAVRNPARNELHLVDGSERSTSILTLDLKTVFTDDTPYPRQKVAWIYLAPSGADTRPKGVTDKQEPAYLWDGTIEVKDEYDGKNGSHEWKGEFKVQFLEERSLATGRTYTATPVGNLEVFKLQLLSVSYTVTARHNWDRGYYAYNGDVGMNGQANGRFTATQLKDNRLVTGSVLTFDAPPTPKYNRSTAFTTRDDFDEFMSSAWRGPGGYDIWVSLYSDLGDPPAKRAMYRGINRTGKMPINGGPDADFLEWVQINGARIVGRLDRPDQTEVRGEYSHPVEGGYSSGPQDPGRVIVRWQLERKSK